MELYNEDDLKQNKKTKAPLIMGILVVLLIIISIIIVTLILYIKSTILSITIDGVRVNDLESILYIQQDENGNSTIYIPIRAIASYFNYEDYSGDYKYKSEDTTKCYVKNEYETAMFTLDSDTIIKTRGDSDYDYVQLDEKVFEKDGELYTTIDGIKKAYNVEFIYDQAKNNIEIYTMDYLVTIYAQSLGYENYSQEFTDKKAIFENMIIIQQNGYYGVVEASTGNLVLEPKYELISYLPSTTDFLVKSNGTYGIMSKEAVAKVNITYDQIKIIDNANGLYLIRKNNFYGVIDIDGNTIIEPEYQQIGINSNSFSENGVENQYVFFDKLIPIKYNNLWAFFDVEGKQITEFEYTNIGCTRSSVTNTYPVLIIPSYEIVVVQKDNFYNLMQTNGNEIINGYVVDSVYMKRNASTGETNFYMTYNGKTEDIEKILADQGL